MARGRGGSFRGSGNRGGRGAGGRGRGTGGRGRGKPTARWGPNRQFDSTRLDQQEDSDSDSEDADSAVDEESSSEEEASDQDDEREAPAKAYMALLQGFSDTAVPTAKRRKLGHERSTSASEHAASKELVTGDGEPDLDAVEGGDDLDAGVEEQPESDSEDDEDLSDPFDLHFAHPDEKTSAERIKVAKAGEWTTTRAMVKPWRATFQHPEPELTIPPPAADLGSFKLKQKLTETAKKKLGKFGDPEKSLAPLLFSYRDVLHCDRTVRNAQSTRQLVCLHALNHILK